MNQKKPFIKNQFEFRNQEDVKNFWKSQIWKLEIKKNICSGFTIVLNLIVALLNIAIFVLLILAIVMIVEKVNGPTYNSEDVNLAGIIFLVSLSITLSLGIIICSFFLISIKNKNKFKIYQNICLDLNNLLINNEKQNVEQEIKNIIEKNSMFKKEKLFKSLKNFVSEDKIKWS